MIIMREKMNGLSDKYIFSLLEFEKCNYDVAVRTWIDIFREDFCNEFREEILKNIYSCFVSPNENEFRESYRNAKVKGRYEDLAVDFIPVTDTCFYYYNKEHNNFGHIDISGIQKCKHNICSVCIVNPSSIEVVNETLCSYNWDSIYVIDSKENSTWKALYKIPPLAEVMKKKIILFEDYDQFQILLRKDSSRYLPKIIIGEEKEKYQTLVKELHRERQRCNVHRSDRRPVLSIYIPSYNRGDSALEAVRRALETDFDTEIEVVISDNGSEKTTDYYNQIREIEDARLTYVRQTTNRYYIGNIIKGFELCKGDYILFLSDEDRTCPSQMMSLINYLINNTEAGTYYPGKIRQINNTNDIIDVSISATYLSGTIFNRKKFEIAGVVDFLKKHKENYYVKVYPHNIAALMSCIKNQYNLYDIKSYDKGIEYPMESTGEVYEYAKVENRICLFDAYAEIVHDLFDNYTVYVNALWSMMNLIVGMLHKTSNVFLDKVDLLEYQKKFYDHTRNRIREDAFSLSDADGELLLNMLTERIEACFNSNDEREAWKSYVRNNK